MSDGPAWVSAAAHDAAVIERHALRHLYGLDAAAGQEIEATQTIVRLARGMRRKLESWQHQGTPLGLAQPRAESR